MKKSEDKKFKKEGRNLLKGSPLTVHFKDKNSDKYNPNELIPASAPRGMRKGQIETNIAKNSDKPIEEIPGAFTQKEKDNMLAGKPIKEDKPNLAKLATACGLEIIETFQAGCGQRYIVKDNYACANSIVFDPFKEDFYGCRCREVLRQAVIDKADELELRRPFVDYEHRKIKFDGYKDNNDWKLAYFCFTNRSEAHAWAEALFWLIGQEQAK